MRVLIATDAWHPQVNGVVRTLTSLAANARKLGVEITFLTPEGFSSVPVPTYPNLRLALPSPRGIARRIEAARPDAIHIATEGSIGYLVRRYCLNRGLPFTTSYTTRFPEYIAARAPIPEGWIYALLRRFHAAATVTMVSTPSLMAEFAERGFKNLGMWTRGVDTDLFKPERAIDLGLPRPIFACVGRIAVEKNLEAFLSLDLPGSKIVIGQGPQEAELRRRFPDQDRYLRCGAARGAGLRRAGRRLSGARAAGRGRAGSGGRAARGLARRLHGRPARVAPGLPRLRALPLVGGERAPVHRPRQPGRDRPLPRTASRLEHSDAPLTARANGASLRHVRRFFQIRWLPLRLLSGAEHGRMA
jgi:hypothetical protein